MSRLPLLTPLLLGLIVFAGCDNRAAQKPAPASQPAVPVSTARAVLSDVDITVSAIGWVESFTSVVVKPQLDGELLEVHISDGDEVTPGQLLFTFDARPFQTALLLAESNLARDQALARDAAREAERLQGLFDSKQGSPRERDEKRADADAKAAQVRADEADLAAAKLRVEYCTIRAPFGGRTGSVMAHRGTITKQNETALVEINQVSPIYVTFAVPERHLPQIRSAADGTLVVRASIPGDESGEEEGRLTFIDNAVDRTTGMVRLKATFPNGDRRLWPGQYVNVRLTTGRLPQAVVVPQTAVQPGQDRSFVFVVGPDARVEARTVETGITTSGGIVVRRGLTADEEVVTDGQLRLTPGAAVVVRGEPAASSPTAQPVAEAAQSQPAEAGGS